MLSGISRPIYIVVEPVDMRKSFDFHRRKFQLFEMMFQKDGGFRFEFFHIVVS